MRIFLVVLLLVVVGGSLAAREVLQAGSPLMDPCLINAPPGGTRLDEDPTGGYVFPFAPPRDTWNLEVARYLPVESGECLIVIPHNELWQVRVRQWLNNVPKEVRDRNEPYFRGQEQDLFLISERVVRLLVVFVSHDLRPTAASGLELPSGRRLIVSQEGLWQAEPLLGTGIFHLGGVVAQEDSRNTWLYSGGVWRVTLNVNVPRELFSSTQPVLIQLDNQRFEVMISP